MEKLDCRTIYHTIYCTIYHTIHCTIYHTIYCIHGVVGLCATPCVTNAGVQALATKNGTQPRRECGYPLGGMCRHVSMIVLIICRGFCVNIKLFFYLEFFLSYSYMLVIFVVKTVNSEELSVWLYIIQIVYTDVFHYCKFWHNNILHFK